jgi:hypothetical protein
VPFTFSHPAIVLPLTIRDKKTFSATALVIGSITPDFEYFANFAQRSLYSHTWPGVFWFDLPVAFVLLYLYNNYVRNPLIDNLPFFLKKRFLRFKKVNGGFSFFHNYRVVLISFIIGIVSHLFWDKLLHKSVSFVEEPWDYYPFFWDGNSVIGAIVIAFMIYRLPKAAAEKTNSFFYWSVTVCVTCIVLAIRSMYSIDLRNLQVSLISGFLIGLLVTSFIAKFRQSKTEAAATYT